MEEYLHNLATDKYNKGSIAGIVKILLFILSFIYGLVIKILFFWARRNPYRLNCKVISVGNITLGGTGKTSLVEYIATYFKSQGYKAAILSRGYKRKKIDAGLPAFIYETMGDEPYMLSRKLGDTVVIVDSNRARGAENAIRNFKADTVILDDGFQQWRIVKDLDIVAIDATCPFGNRHLLPRGILREPLSSLKRADIFVLTKTNLNSHNYDIKDFLSRINPGALIFESVHKPLGFYEVRSPCESLSLEMFKGKTVTLFSGIGDPASFEALVRKLNINIGLCFRFRDHHHYTQQDLDKIIKASQDKAIDTIITTEKDAVRLYGLQGISYYSQGSRVTAEEYRAKPQYRLQILFLRIGLAITKDEQGFRNRLL